MSGSRLTPRGVAIAALVRVDGGAFANLVLPELLRRTGLDARERAFATDLTYRAVRAQRASDHLLHRVVSRPLAALDPEVRAALRLGTSQLLTGVPAHAAVGETVAEVPARARGFANGVLRSVSRLGPPWPLPSGDDDESLGIRTSHPDWIVAELAATLGRADAAAVLELDNEPPAVTLRVNPTRATVDDVVAELRAAGIDVELGALLPSALLVRGTGDVSELPAVREGRVTPQDQGSQAVVAIVGARSGERVLDLAAAPGGKSTGIAEQMGDDGVVVAADLHSGRTGLIARAAARLGLRSVHPVVADARRPPVRAVFDRVLLDAPCSGLGVLRRRPEARWRVTSSDVDDLANLQRVLLRAAAATVRPGGRLVYSVCTLTERETLGVDEWAADALADWRPVPPPGEPWRSYGRGALLSPTVAGSDAMYVLALDHPST
ncbi:MAG TPA: 16S rRNA (cytosine(967)-C(5))-methyltransferase RsmB [Acidimicrobiia bacterium]|nr:16S rRNA (cytosine(967)-C(5))-methyltransferase RsmB [Acidimicrobiia bacterium]